ncbi:MAG: Hsp70 family protein [Chlamydiales bacterium]|nr:Hsp70 family protein [Chlamydiales bacterium]
MSKYVIGIDLGTTNCCLAWADKENLENDTQINSLIFSQYNAQGDLKGSSSLPSFIFFPSEQEKTALSELSNDYVVGELARAKSQEVPTKVISSAKSWLCQNHIDKQIMLPHIADEEDTRLKPVEAIATLLKTIKEAWEEQFPEAPFNEQEVLITVPASFDPNAQSLVQQSAWIAEYPEFKFLEEPQAAFYAYLCRQEKWRDDLEPGDRVLVVDIGGGTCDFSLIEAVENEGQLNLERLAVGSHLLLGGDNMDLALAYSIKLRLQQQGTEIDEWQFNRLVNQSRYAKEYLLSDEEQQQIFKGSIESRGSSLIASSIPIEITREDVHQVILDGFFPILPPDEQALIEKRAALSSFGLPFAKDPRFTAQLAKFLSRTGESNNNSLENFQLPTKVLFNGGVLRSKSVQGQLKKVFAFWSEKLDQKEPEVLSVSSNDLDLSVSIGACYYGIATQGKGVRIKADLACSYFIGVESNMPAIPGIPVPVEAMCIAPYGMEESEEHSLKLQSFNLLVGQEAVFRFFMRSTNKLSNGESVSMGTKVPNWEGQLKELSSLSVKLESNESKGYVQVYIRSKYTEMGTLELWFDSLEGEQWKVEFNLRELPELAKS